MKRSLRVAAPLLAATAVSLNAQGLVALDYDVSPKVPASITSLSDTGEESNSTQRGGFGTWFVYLAVAAGALYILSVGE